MNAPPALANSDSLGVAWTSSLCLPGESLWSLWSKLCYLNAFSTSEIRVLLGDLSQTTSTLFLGEELATRTPPTLLERVFSAPTGAANSWMHPLARPPYAPHGPFTKTPRLCVRCARLGFHCLTFQLNSVLRCPVHGCELIERCPVCNSTFPHMFCAIGRAPFQCSLCHASLSQCNDWTTADAAHIPTTTDPSWPDVETHLCEEAQAANARVRRLLPFGL
jgi:hypothetical protein